MLIGSCCNRQAISSQINNKKSHDSMTNIPNLLEPTTIAILGGTGALGSGLAKRWTKAGYPIVIGSRDSARAEKMARSIGEHNPSAPLLGCSNLEAAQKADLIVLTVPFSHQLETLKEVQPALTNKLLIDVTVPLQPPKVGTVQMPPEGSAALRAQTLLGENVQVVSAFQNVSAEHLNSGHAIDCDVLVTGNQRSARDQVVTLVEAIGMRAWHAGPLANSVATEALTSLLITINRHHQLDGAGIRITGNPLPDKARR